MKENPLRKYLRKNALPHFFCSGCGAAQTLKGIAICARLEGASAQVINSQSGKEPGCAIELIFRFHRAGTWRLPCRLR